jgi:hypothetical protein
VRVRTAGIAVVAVLFAAAAWYLGSPLFIRTTVNEAFPTAAAQSAAPSRSAAAAAATPSGPTTLATGELGYVDAIHNGKGTVLLVRTEATVVLRFDNVAITNAPDVHVYLSRDTGGKWSEATSLYVGPLKATNGSFNYVVQGADPDLSLYKSVVVWCRQFSVLVSWADLR